MSLSFKHRGSFENLETFLSRMRNFDIRRTIEPYAREGVLALAANTPVDSGIAANSWDYYIYEDQDSVRIVWTNDNVEGGFPVVIMLQYGYATGSGGYVQGRDFINPAIRPIFDKIADGVWKEVSSA